MFAVTRGQSSSQGHVRQAVGEPAAGQEALVANERLARLSAPAAAVKPGAKAAAIAQRAKIATLGHTIKGSAGGREPYGDRPMQGDGSQFTRVANQGMGDLAGRVNHFAYDAPSGRLFASVGQGGVWVLDKGSSTWRSVGDSLPTQAVGGIGYTKGTLIALTGNDV